MTAAPIYAGLNTKPCPCVCPLHLQNQICPSQCDSSSSSSLCCAPSRNKPVHLLMFNCRVSSALPCQTHPRVALQGHQHRAAAGAHVWQSHTCDLQSINFISWLYTRVFRWAAEQRLLRWTACLVAEYTNVILHHLHTYYITLYVENNTCAHMQEGPCASLFSGKFCRWHGCPVMGGQRGMGTRWCTVGIYTD